MFRGQRPGVLGIGGRQPRWDQALVQAFLVPVPRGGPGEGSGHPFSLGNRRSWAGSGSDLGVFSGITKALDLQRRCGTPIEVKPLFPPSSISPRCGLRSCYAQLVSWPTCTLCYTLGRPGRKSVFRAGFWSDASREGLQIGPSAGLGPTAAAASPPSPAPCFRRPTLVLRPAWGRPEGRC